MESNIKWNVGAHRRRVRRGVVERRKVRYGWKHYRSSLLTVVVQHRSLGDVGDFVQRSIVRALLFILLEHIVEVVEI